VRVLVATGDQSGWAGFVQASTTTGMFVAQEMMKPNRLVRTPKLGPLPKLLHDCPVKSP
jgi:hypothetical protein